MNAITKDPQARLDYGTDWGAWLAAGESITAHTVTGTGGLTVESSSVVGSQVVAWVTGGTGGTASLRFHITTSAGRQDDRTLPLWVGER